jgi:UDP-N-acetylglucosamine--N-acetylmuramyl-(pentapeptide) pyrophosphoryl-undecaprenol N-acetylglucosamine transferase
MIICPLPTAAMDHQTSNAIALEKAGAAVHVPQRELTGEALDRIVRSLLADGARLRALREHALARAQPNAAREIAEYVLALLGRAGR